MTNISPPGSKCHVFTDCDLDGAGSYHILTKILGYHVPYTVTRVNEASDKIESWLSRNDISEYDRVYILDLDLSQHPELQKKVDRTNVTIVDHHKQHIDLRNDYKHAETIITNDTSTCKLVYKHLSGKDKLTEQEKLLVLMVDDYDAYKFDIPNSYELNIIFWSYQGNRVEKFQNDFADGFCGFTSQQQNIIQFYKRRLENIKSSLQIHRADIPIKGTVYRVVAVFADSYINDIADHIIKNYKCDIGFVINLKSNKVSLRRATECTMDLNWLAKSLFDQGGGHEAASGGIICDKFLTFSQLFKPLHIKQF